VFDSRGLSDYPPQHNAWQFPPPPISPRWKWAAIAAMVLGLVGGSTMLVVAISVGSSGAPGLIDNTELISVIERECQQMTTKVESLPIHGTPRRQAQTIAAQNVAIEDMVDDIRSVGQEVLADDPPTDEWLADWGRLVDAREAYAEEILDGSLPDLQIPTDERGKDIYVRMDDVFIADSTCEVPGVLLNPYPDDASDA
jgi:hypothetical protein